MKGYINKIETMGTSDGPGLRVVVFMQGCPLRCVYCHNPEMFSLKGGIEYTPRSLVEFILRYKSYFGSDGGVTFSGGEPFMQFDFLWEVCQLLKNHNINICLDTCGIGLKNDKILSIIDIVLMDIKYIDNKGYESITGVAKYEESISFLKKCQEYGKEIWFRQVIIPGINDDIIYIKKLKELAKQYQPVNIELLPFHTMGFSKYESIGIENKLINTKDLDMSTLDILYQELNKD